MFGFYSDRADEGLQVRVSLEEVAKVENIVPAVEHGISDQETETAGTEFAASEREVEYRRGIPPPLWLLRVGVP